MRRVTETLVVDRMALMLAPGGCRQDEAFVTVAHAGLWAIRGLSRAASEAGTRLISGHALLAR